MLKTVALIVWAFTALGGMMFTSWVVPSPIFGTVAIGALISIFRGRSSPRVALSVACTYVLYLFAFGMFFLYMRLVFFLEHDGMEGEGGYGSPLAFVFGFVIEQVLLSLAPVLFFCASYFLYRRRVRLAL